jgi:hypothetical protein
MLVRGSCLGARRSDNGDAAWGAQISRNRWHDFFVSTHPAGAMVRVHTAYHLDWGDQARPTKSPRV